MAVVTVLVGKLLGKKRSTEFKLPGQSSGFVFDAIVSYDFVDEAEPTDNPVEEGVDITDHVHVKPKQLTIKGVHSNTPLDLIASVAGAGAGIGAIAGRKYVGPFAGAASAVAAGALTALARGGGSRAKNAYDYLLELQAKRIPFSVITGLREYRNMMITRLSVTKDQSTGEALDFTCSLREIRVVRSQTVFIPNTADGVAGGDRAKLGKKATEEVSTDRRSQLKAGYDALKSAFGGS